MKPLGTPIQITQAQFDMATTVVALANMRGKRINTKIVYELWPKLFGLRKVSNGCNACSLADLGNFAMAWKALVDADAIQIEEPQDNLK
jgi:hypothetical protein